MSWRVLSIVTCVVLVSAASSNASAEPRIDWHVTAYSDGAHNAFTDLVQWNGLFYLCFRHGESHASMDGDIRIMTSPDMKTWTPNATLDTYGDDRDPKFVVAGEKLYVYFGVWDLVHRSGADLPDRGVVRSYFVSTEDGKTWSKIQGVYEPGFWLWRIRHHDGYFYSAAYTAVRPKPDTRETRILRSADGLNWELVSLLTKDRLAGEADLLWRPDGAVWVLTRTGDKAGDAEWFTSDADMKTWTSKATGARIHAPAFATWKDRVFVAGRDYQSEGSTTKVWEIVDGNVVERLLLPSGGDTSYPGLIPDPKADANGSPTFFITWYSQHENNPDDRSQRHVSNIYAARIIID